LILNKPFDIDHHLRTIVHPICSSFSLALFASSLVAYLSKTFGNFSTASLASLSPN